MRFTITYLHSIFSFTIIVIYLKPIESLPFFKQVMPSSSFFTETKSAGTTIQITFDKNDTETPKYGLGYWSIRGLGAPLTMMLCAAKVPFTLFLYDILEKDDGGWTSDYFVGKTEYIQKYDAPLWNLPFCIDREKEEVICQTNAMFAYLGRVCGMFGSDDKTTSQCEQLICEIYDLRNVMIKYAYGPPGTEPDKVLSEAKRHFSKLEGWLDIEAKKVTATSHDKKAKPQIVHLVDGKFSAPDFHLFEMIDQFDAFTKFYELGDLLTDYPRLKDFYDGFASLE